MMLKLSEANSNTAMPVAWMLTPQMLAAWLLRKGQYSTIGTSNTDLMLASESGTLPTILVAKQSNAAACRCAATTHAADLVAALDHIAILAKRCEELKDQLRVSRHENEGVSLTLSRSND
jgi:hypothetical protein